VTILPPMPGFYNHPETTEEIVDHIVMRILDQFGIHIDLSPRWNGQMAAGDQRPSG
jgi:4-hydroxy-3-polyprenylbenzoate decarboxylase